MKMTRKMRRAKKRRDMLNRMKDVVARSIAVAITSTALLFGGPVAEAMPAGGQIVAGQATISQSGNQMTVAQATAQAILNWQSFSIGAQEQVRFIQPSALSVILNRVIGTDASAIYGQMSANGQVFLINPNGILFAPGSRVDVGSLVASTLSITNEDFMRGRYIFSKGTGIGGVLNQGMITASDKGTVALLGAQVRNEGLVVAHMGTVALGSGEEVSLDFAGDGKVSMNVNKGTLGAIAGNSGLIEADGGRVIMTARAGDDLASAVVNQSGIVRARSLGNQTGEVAIASSGDIHLTGQIDVSGRQAGESGGTASVIAGEKLVFPSEAVIDASGTSKGGSVETSGKTVQIAGAVKAADWLIDPINITIVDAGGQGNISPATSTISADVIAAALNTGNVTIDTGTTTANGNDNGDITVAANITAANAADRMLTLTAANNITIDAGKTISTSGEGRLNITLEAASDGANGGYVKAAGASILTNGGALVIGGKEGQGANRALSVTGSLPGVDLTSAVINTSRTSESGVNGGAVTVHGQVNATASDTNARGIDASGTSITTGGGAVILDGFVNAGPAAGVTAATAAGVYLSDATTINTVRDSVRGAVNIIGRNNGDNAAANPGGRGNGIHLGNASVTSGDLLLAADRISFGSGIISTLTGAETNTATITTTTAGRAVSAGDDAGIDTLNVSNDAFKQLTGYGKHVVQSSGGAVTIANATLSQDTSIETTGSGTITVGGVLNGSGKNVRLAAGTSGSGTGQITNVSGLRLEATDDWNLTNVTSDVNTLSAQARSVTFTDADSIELGQVTVGGTTYNGVTVTGTTSTITAAGGNVTLARNLAKTGPSSSTVNIRATGDILFTNGSDVTAALGPLNLNLYADTDGNGGRVVGQGGNTSIATNGGSLTIAGGAADGSGYAKGTPAGAGVDLAGTTINVGNGELTIRGEANDGATKGVDLAGTAITRGSGTVTIEGRKPAAGSGPAVDLTNVMIGQGSGALTLTGDAITFSGGYIGGSGSLRIQPLTPGGNINLGAAAGAGELNIGSNVFGATNADSIVKNGFSSITIGRDNGSGTITQSGTITFRDNLTIKAPDAGGQIHINGILTDTANTSEKSTLTLIAPTVNFNNGAQVATHTTGAGVSVDSTTTQFAGDAAINANGGDVSVTADTLEGQNTTFSLTSSGAGILSIRQKTAGRELKLGGTLDSAKLFIDSLAADNITGFSHVKFGDRTAGGKVTIDGYAAPAIKTTVLSAAANGAGSMTGDVIAANGLVLATGGMNQIGGTLTTSELGLIGPGDYSFDQTGNQIAKLATDSGAGAVGALTVKNQTSLTVGEVFVPSGVSHDNPLSGITATGDVKLTVTDPAVGLTIDKAVNANSGAVTLQADELAVNGNIRTTGVLTLKPNDATRVINIGNGDSAGFDFNPSTLFSPGGYLGGGYSKIVIGSSMQKGIISVKDTTFSAPVELITDKSAGANVVLSGIVNVGSVTAPFKDLTVRADRLNTTGVVNVKDLVLDLNDFGGVGGTVNGSGNLTITGPSGKDVVLVGTEESTAWDDYEIPYAKVNSVFLNFENFAIEATGSGHSADGDAADVILQTGTLNRSLSLKSNDKVIIDGTVTLGEEASQVTVNAPVFLLKGGTSTAGFAKGTIDAGTASFTIITDKIDDQQTNQANITGSGTLTVKPKTKKLVILGTGTEAAGDEANGNETTELLLTEAQINGELFAKGAFTNLILGDRNGTTDTEIRGNGTDSVKLDNNLTIAAGVANKVEITGNGGLEAGTSTSSRKVTLQGGTVSNNGKLLNAHNGSLTFAANTLELSGIGTVRGAGTLGITTFDGSRKIYVGYDGTGSVLNLNQSLFTAGGAFDWSNFTHVKIGSASQTETITVDGFTKPSNVTGITFQTASSGANSKVVFAGNLHAAGATVTVDTAVSSQALGIITASAVNLQTGDHVLNQDNVVDTIAANAKSVSFTSVKPLTVGEASLSDTGTSTSGVTASGTGTDAIRLTGKNTTEETGGIQITQAVTATSSGGISLTGDELKFSGSGSVKSNNGALKLHPYTATRTITLGGMNTTTGLDLKAGYFNGNIIKDGFSSVTIGTAAVTGSSGTVNVIGPDALIFKDNTIIQSALTDGVINLRDGADIQHGNNSLEFRTPTLNANDGGTEAAITGAAGAQTFTVDRMNVPNGNFFTAGNLVVRTLTAGRGITVGAAASDPGMTQLFLNQDWFKSADAASRTFNDGYGQITIGDPANTGKITIKDDVRFTDNTRLTALGAGGSIDIGAAGSPNNIPAKITVAGGNNLTLEARTITTYDTSVIESETGTTTLTADTMSFDPGTRVKGTGELIVQPYTTTRAISLGTDPNPGNTLNLKATTLGQVFTPGHTWVTIGRANSNANITLNGVTFHNDVRLRNPSGGGISITGPVDMDNHALELNVPGAVTGTGALTNVSQLSGNANSVILTNYSNTIKKIKNLTTVQEMTVYNTGELSLDGDIVSTGGDVTIRTKGDLTLEAAGTVKAQSGGGQVLLAADNNTGSYDNNFINKSGADGILAGQQFLVLSGKRQDTVRDNLIESVIRFGAVDFSDSSSYAPISANSSGFLYSYQPVISLFATKVYGNPAAWFTYTELGSTLAENGLTLEEAGLNDLGSYTFGNVYVNGVLVPGNPGQTDADVAAYTGNFTGIGENNPFGIKVNPVTFSVTPKTLTITMNDAAFVYGNSPGLSSLIGASGVWAGNGGLAPNAKVKSVSGLVNGDQVADIDLSFSGVSSASNVGSYADSVIGSGTAAGFATASDRNNYTIKVIKGNTVITPRPITLTAGSGSRVYGDANPVITGFAVSSGNLVNGDAINSVTNSIAATATVTANAGTSHAVSASNPVFADAGDLNNYDVSYTPGALTITQRSLIIEAPSGTRRKGEDNSSVQYTPAAFDQAVQVLADGQVRTVSDVLVTGRGLVNGDSVSSVSAPVVDPALTSTSNAGTYADRVSVGGAVFGSGDSANYQITYAPNTLTIKAPITASPDVEAPQAYSRRPLREPDRLLPNSQPPATNRIDIGSGSVGVTIQPNGGGVEINFGGRANDRPELGDGGRHDNAGIPVLYTSTSGDNVRFDGVYKVNYTDTKLSILPASVDVPIPDRREITRGSFIEFSIVQRAGQTGTFEVNVGNGIITIKPVDAAARNTLARQDDKNATKTVMGAGILSAVRDLRVMPDQIRAMYIFTE